MLGVKASTCEYWGEHVSVHSSHLVVNLLDCVKSASSPSLDISKLISKVAFIIYTPTSKCVGYGIYIYIYFDGIFFTRTTGHGVFPNRSSFSLFLQYVGSLPYSCLNLGFFQSVLAFVAMVLYFTWKVPSPSVMFFSCREVIFLIM